MTSIFLSLDRYFIIWIIIAIILLFILLVKFEVIKLMPKKNEVKDSSQVIQPLDVKKEPFNNDLPNPKIDSEVIENINKTDDYVDYNEIIKNEALEKSVFDQHNSYIKEKNKVTNTASRNPTRSDSQDLIPFVGLRRPQYQVNGKDMVDSTARQVPSVIDADQLAKPNNLRWD